MKLNAIQTLSKTKSISFSSNVQSDRIWAVVATVRQCCQGPCARGWEVDGDGGQDTPQEFD